MLQIDGLHLTQNGLIALTAMLLDELIHVSPILVKDKTLVDPAAISARLLKMKNRTPAILRANRL